MKINWGRAFAGALIAEIAQIAAAFGWVAIYSYLINPGQPMATYQAHAQASGPWVSLLAGAPIFYAASRWIAPAAGSRDRGPPPSHCSSSFLWSTAHCWWVWRKAGKALPLSWSDSVISPNSAPAHSAEPMVSPAFVVHIKAHPDEIWALKCWAPRRRCRLRTSKLPICKVMSAAQG